MWSFVISQLRNRLWDVLLFQSKVVALVCIHIYFKVTMKLEWSIVRLNLHQLRVARNVDKSL
jgi:uncharacterized protein with HEPN domain